MSEKPARSNSRRRFLQIVGLAGGAVVAGVPISTELFPERRKPVSKANPYWNWRGFVLGANANIQIHGLPEARAAELTSACFDRMRELEMIFSLYEKDSAISTLNREGVLKDPPAELVALLRKAKAMHKATSGAFDVTVQPLWNCYSEHYGKNPLAESPPPEREIEAARSRIGSEHLQVDEGRIAFARPGMSLTPNGIAQGFVTDIISELLAHEGVEHTLINLGEYRAIGSHPAGRPWEIGIRAPGMEEEALSDSLALAAGDALAVSGGHGTTFDAEGRFHHLLHPTKTRQQPASRTIAIRAASATEADALSTACGVVDDNRARWLARRRGASLRIYGS